MTISTTSNQISYTGDGATLGFAFPFPFITPADLKVFIDGVQQFSGFSVSGSVPFGGSGTYSSGSVAFLSAPANGATVLIYSDPDQLQSTSLPANDPFPSKTVEKMIDKLTLLVQAIYRKFGNAITFPPGDTASGVLPAASVRAGKLLGFDVVTGAVTLVTAAVGSAVALALQLASSIGSSLMGFIQSGAGAVARLVQDKLRERLTYQDFGAVGDGVADDTAAINATHTAAIAQKRAIDAIGVLRYTSLITNASPISIFGIGALANVAGVGSRSPSTFLKDFDSGTGPGWLVSGDSVQIDGCQFDSVIGRTGDVLQIKGSRFRSPSLTVSNGGRDNLRIGSDDVGANSNAFRIGDLITLAAGRHGCHINDPTGPTDAGAGRISHIDARGCLGSGVKHDNGAWNTIKVVVAQTCDIGFEIAAGCRALTLCGGDLEGNTTFQGVIRAGAVSNRILGSWFGTPATWIDNSAVPGGNIVEQYNTGVSKMINGVELNTLNPDTASTTQINFHLGAFLLGQIRIALSGVDGAVMAFRTKVSGGALTTWATLDQNGTFRFLGRRTDTLSQITYSVAMTPDAAAGNQFQITANNGTAFAINAPTNPPAQAGQKIDFIIRNTSGGALGVATWNAVFKLAAWTQPASGFSRSIQFKWDGSNWIENGRTTVDVPN